MTNREKFKEWFDTNIDRMICMGMSFGVSKDGKPFICDEVDEPCSECRFHSTGETCYNCREKWLNDDVKECAFKDGDAVVAFDIEKKRWVRRYFCMYKDGKYFVYADGKTAFTAEKTEGMYSCEEYSTVLPYTEDFEKDNPPEKEKEVILTGRKYLDDIGVTDRPDTWNKDDERQSEWAKQREIYGFDERETWSLDTTFYMWLYERLMMYKEVHTGESASEFEFDGDVYSESELVDRLLDRLKCVLTADFNEQGELAKEVGEIWAIILPSMWW